MGISISRIPIAVIGTLLSSLVPVCGFTNLDFEDATVVSNDPVFGFLDWNLAAPGWEHSSGSATEIIYYGNIHLGTDQVFFLRDQTSTLFGPPLPRISQKH